MLTGYFSCPKCGLKKVAFECPAREGPHQDVLVWMREVVARAASIEHDKHSPNCHPDSLKDLMLPCDPTAEFLGQQIE